MENIKKLKNFFSDESNNFENISLIGNGKQFADDFEIADTFNKYFQNLVPNLDLYQTIYFCQTPLNGDEILAAISKYQDHPTSKQSLKNAILVFLSISVSYRRRKGDKEFRHK